MISKSLKKKLENRFFYMEKDIVGKSVTYTKVTTGYQMTSEIRYGDRCYYNLRSKEVTLFAAST